MNDATRTIQQTLSDLQDKSRDGIDTYSDLCRDAYWHLRATIDERDEAHSTLRKLLDLDGDQVPNKSPITVGFALHVLTLLAHETAVEKKEPRALVYLGSADYPVNLHEVALTLLKAFAEKAKQVAEAQADAGQLRQRLSQTIPHPQAFEPGMREHLPGLSVGSIPQPMCDVDGDRFSDAILYELRKQTPMLHRIADAIDPPDEGSTTLPLDEIMKATQRTADNTNAMNHELLNVRALLARAFDEENGLLLRLTRSVRNGCAGCGDKTDTRGIVKGVRWVHGRLSHESRGMMIEVATSALVNFTGDREKAVRHASAVVDAFERARLI